MGTWETTVCHSSVSYVSSYRHQSLVQAVDFDPTSLRRTLPVTVRLLHEAISTGRKVYVHCTAGLGRAPAVCIAYNFWYHDVTLDEVWLQSRTPLGPHVLSFGAG